MANDVSTNPHHLDTVGSQLNLAFPSTVFCEQVELVGSVSVADSAIIRNKAGKIVAELTGTTDGTAARTGKIGKIEGGYYLAVLSNAGTHVNMYIR